LEESLVCKEKIKWGALLAKNGIKKGILLGITLFLQDTYGCLMLVTSCHVLRLCDSRLVYQGNHLFVGYSCNLSSQKRVGWLNLCPTWTQLVPYVISQEKFWAHVLQFPLCSTTLEWSLRLGWLLSSSYGHP